MAYVATLLIDCSDLRISDYSDMPNICVAVEIATTCTLFPVYLIVRLTWLTLVGKRAKHSCLFNCPTLLGKRTKLQLKLDHGDISITVPFVKDICAKNRHVERLAKYICNRCR